MSIARITPSGEVIAEGPCNTVLVPSSQIALFATQLPAKNRSQAEKLAAFSLEEQLSEDIENLHFSVKRLGDKWLVAVIEVQLLESWLAKLAEKNIKPTQLVPDIMAVDNSIDILEEPEQILINNLTEPTQPSTDDQQTDSQTEQQKSPRDVTADTIDDFLPCGVCIPLFETLLDSFQVPQSRLNQLNCFYSADYAELLHKVHTLPKNTLNLIRNYGPNQISFMPWLRPWVLSLVLAFVMLGLVSFSIWQNNTHMQGQIQLSQQNNLRLFRQTFPDIDRIVNLRSQARVRFDELQQLRQRNSGGLITLLNLSIPVLIENPDISILSLRFQNFGMQLELRASQVSIIEKAIQTMNQQKQLKVEVNSLAKRADQAQAQVRISKQL